MKGLYDLPKTSIVYFTFELRICRDCGKCGWSLREVFASDALALLPTTEAERKNPAKARVAAALTVWFDDEENVPRKLMPKT